MSNEQWAMSNEQWAMSNEQWAPSTEHRAPHRAMSNELWWDRYMWKPRSRIYPWLTNLSLSLSSDETSDSLSLFACDQSWRYPLRGTFVCKWGKTVLRGLKKLHGGLSEVITQTRSPYSLAARPIVWALWATDCYKWEVKSHLITINYCCLADICANLDRWTQ